MYILTSILLVAVGWGNLHHLAPQEEFSNSCALPYHRTYMAFWQAQHHLGYSTQICWDSRKIYRPLHSRLVNTVVQTLTDLTDLVTVMLVTIIMIVLIFF